MWSLLLTLGLFVDSGLRETVHVPFRQSGTVAVQRPPDLGADYTPRAQPPLYSPRRDAAALRFCWDLPRAATCQVFLVRPGLPTRALPRSDVTRLLWTPDGRYLIGAGADKIRLWNLAGGVRVQMPRPPEVEVDRATRTRAITGIHLEGNDLCVVLLADVFSRAGGRAAQQSTTTRYVLPALHPAESVSLPTRPGTDPPCHALRTGPG